MTTSKSIDARAENLFDDFTLNQLKELAASISLGKEIESLHGKNKAQIIAVLGRTGDVRKKALTAHKLEAITPYKHIYLYTFINEITYEAMAAACRHDFPALVDGFSPLPRDSGSLLHLQLCLLDDQKHRIFFKFAHQVDSWETVKTSASHRTQQLTRRRHPVVATFYSPLRLVVIGFPGFTQSGVSYKERSTYLAIAAAAAQQFTEHTKLELQGFQAKNAIEKLLADPEAQVMDIKRSIKPQEGGRIVLDSGEDEAGLAVYLSTYLREGNVAVDAGNVRSLLQSGTADDIWLLWKKLGLLTRIALQQSVPELLVVWRGEGPDLTKIDAALQALVGHLSASTSSETLAVAEEIDKSPVGSIIIPASLAQHFNLTTDQALRALTNAASQHRVEVRFRVRTDAVLQDFENHWRSTLIEFPQQVTDEHGHAIDLTDRKHIEVAFERVS